MNPRFEIKDQATKAFKASQSKSINRRILEKIAKRVIQNSKKRVTAQQNVDGSPFAPHAKGRKRKMLTRLMKKVATVYADDAMAIVGFNNSFEEQIAAKHQFGFEQNFKAADFKDRKSLSTKDPATRQQAKELIAAGYVIKRKNGKGTQKPSIKWITQNLNMGKAGLILRVLRGKKTEWKTKLPAREVLGISDEDLSAAIEIVAAEFKMEIELAND